jgi:hypothetical protein
MKPSLLSVTLLTAILTLLTTSAIGAGGVTRPSATAAATEPREIKWDELVPPGWDPMAELRDKLKNPATGFMSDADPRMLELLRELREVWDNAPINESMDGVLVKLPGYLVPLEEANGAVKEFLLVPYFGACIHSPPPPANQIVHVVLSKPAHGLRAMDVVWISGKMQAKRVASYMGKSGYHMTADKVEPYVAPRK